MKIIIVGAGISGLSTYLHLRKHLSQEHTIAIYESHAPRSSNHGADQDNLNIDALSSSTVLVGGGLGISPNGMRVLRTLDPALHAAITAQGFPSEHFVFKAANGWTLGKQKTSDAQFIGDKEVPEVCVASSRHGLWETLLKHVGDGIVKYRRVVGVERDDGTGLVTVRLVDQNGEEEIDVGNLLIGADGSRSVVRTALFGDDEQFKPQYTGQSGVGGFLNKPIPAVILEDKRMVFTFGGNGFFGYASSAPATSHSLMWWSTFETSTLPQMQSIDKAAIKEELKQRHQRWKDPIVQGIIGSVEVQSIYPTWVVPKLPHWGENGIVLVGDAAHAMDPTTGQGASQALEDSQTLALLLAECLKRGEEGEHQGKQAVELAIKLFYDIRSPRTQKIVERGKKLAGKKVNVGIVAEYFMYFFLWMLNTFPSIGKRIIGDVNRELSAWSAEEETSKAFQQRDPNWLYAQIGQGL